MIMALRVQCAMNDQMRQMVPERLVLCARLASHDRHANDDVGADRLLHVVEGEHVGSVVLSAKLAIQATAFGRADKAQYEIGIALECELQPAPEGRARWQGSK